MFEADLEKALLLSKLEYEEHKMVCIYVSVDSHILKVLSGQRLGLTFLDFM
jgi:hypothetical protein